MKCCRIRGCRGAVAIALVGLLGGAPIVPAQAKHETPAVRAAEADSEIANMLSHIESILLQQQNGTAADINQLFLAASGMYHYASAKGQKDFVDFPNRLNQRAAEALESGEQTKADNIAYFLRDATPFVEKLTGEELQPRQYAIERPPMPPAPKQPEPFPLPPPDTQPTPSPAILATPKPPAEAPNARAREMMSRGDQMLNLGNLIAARLFYERAAQMGFAPAARRMGDTYTASFLTDHNIIGPAPDQKEADGWYDKAKAMDASTSTTRLTAGNRDK